MAEGEVEGQPPEGDADGSRSRGSAAAAAAAQGNGEFLGRRDVEVGDDGSITFSLSPGDASVGQLASDILGRLRR